MDWSLLAKAAMVGFGGVLGCTAAVVLIFVLLRN
jgi:hypothetical protein